MKNKKNIQKILKVGSLTLLGGLSLIGSTQLLSKNIKSNKSSISDDTLNVESNNTCDKKITAKSVSGSFSKQLASTEKKKIEAGTYGPRGILLPTSDHKATYFDENGQVIWESNKVFSSTASSVDENQFISSVYANGKFYTVYCNEDSGKLQIYLCVIDEKTGDTISDALITTASSKTSIFRFGGYFLINVKNIEDYIVFVSRSATIESKIFIIDTNTNNPAVSFQGYEFNNYDQIPSIQAQYENGYIYMSYIFMDKGQNNSTYLKFIRIDMTCNSRVELKSFNLSNFLFFDWPYIGNQAIEMTMHLTTNGNNYNVFLNFINTAASAKSIYSCEFNDNTTQLNLSNLTKTDFNSDDFNINVNYAKVINNSFYIWANSSWISNSPHIIKIDGGIKITKSLMNEINSNKLIGTNIRVFEVDNPIGTMILGTSDNNYVEFINCSNNSYFFSCLSYSDTYVDESISTNGISAKMTALAQYSPYEIAATFNQDLRPSPIEDFIYYNRNQIFKNLPSSISSSADDFVSTDTTANGSKVYAKYISNTETSLTFGFTLKTYYSDGLLVNQWHPYSDSEHKIFTITIKDLTNKPKTDFDVLISLTSTDLGYNNSAILSDVENEVKTKVQEKLKSDTNVNLPSDVTFSDINLTNNYDGTATITLKPNKYYNDYGFVETNTTNKIFTISLSGFGTRQPSNSNSQTWTVNQIELNNAGLPSENSDIENKVSDYALTQLNIWNLPNGTTFRSELANTNNLQGTAIVNLYASQYYDEHGVLQTSEWSKPIVITVSGFDRSSESSFDNINITASDINYDITTLPSDVTDTNLEQRVSSYIKTLSNANLPSDATLTIVGSPTKNNLLGQISVVMKPNKYYNSIGVPTENDGSKIITVNISGFKTSNTTVVPTTLTTQDIGLGDMSSQLAGNNIDNAKNKLSQYITDNINKPSDSIVSVVFKTLDKFNGAIIYTVTLSKYYDSNGVPTGPKDYEISITGFLNQNKQDTTLSKTSFNIRDLLTSYNGQTLNYIYQTDNDLRNLIWEKRTTIFSNLENNVTVNDLIISAQRNYKIGTLSVNIKLKKYVQDGYSQTNDSGKDFGLISIIEFATQSPSLLNNESVIANQVGSTLDVTVGSVQDSIANNVRTVIRNNKDRFNLPSDANVSVTIKSSDKINGLIVLTISVDKWFDENGQLQPSSTRTSQTKSFELTVTGYIKQNKQNTIINNNISSENIPISSLTDGTDLANKPINDISDDQIKEIILNNKDLFFNNLPADITNDDFIINILRNGDQVKAVIKLKKAVYDGYYQENPSGFSIGELTFTGFINQNSGNDFVNNDESSKQWYENIWIWVGAGSGILLIILIIVITIILKKIKEEKK